jgi:hypothetical protein
VTVALRSRRKASPFWIILLLVSGRTDNGPIGVEPNVKVADGGGSEAGSNFDTSRFESSQPSQPPRSLTG